MFPFGNVTVSVSPTVAASLGLLVVIAVVTKLCWSRIKSISAMKVALTFAITSLLALFGDFGYGYHKKMQFDAKYTDYVRAAYNANDYDSAEKYYTRAMKHLEEIDATSGPEQTAVLYEGASYNAHDWSKSVKHNYEMFASKSMKTKTHYVSVSSSPEKDEAWWRTSMLADNVVRLDSKDAVQVNTPPGMHLYPFNGLYLLVTTLLGGTSVIGMGSALACQVIRRRKQVLASCSHCGHQPTK